MKHLISIFILAISLNAFALNSQPSFSSQELKKNETVARGSAGDEDQTPVVAARVLQLQLKALSCESPIVVPTTMMAASDYSFLVESENCVIKKSSEDCGPGFLTRNMVANPHTPNAEILGLKAYKVCIKSNEPSHAKKPSSR